MSRKEQVFQSILLQLESRLKDVLATSFSLLDAVKNSGQISAKHAETFKVLEGEFKKLEAKAQEIKEKITQIEKDNKP